MQKLKGDITKIIGNISLHNVSLVLLHQTLN